MTADPTSVQPPTEKMPATRQRSMRETILMCVFLGLLAPAVSILGAEPFEVRGRNSIWEIVGGGVAVALYLAICQFAVAPKGSRGLGTKRVTLIAMGAPLILAVVAVAFLESPRTALVQGLPVMIAAGCGLLAGAVLAGRVKRPAEGAPNQG